MKTSKCVVAQYSPLGWAGPTPLWLACAICMWLFASKGTVAQTAVDRDQQAMVILNQTITACGGQSLLSSLQDFTETGTITYNWADQITANVTVKSRRLRQFRIDAGLANGTRTTVVNGESGSLIDTDGRSTPIYRQSALVLKSVTLPCLPLIAAAQDTSTSVVYGGLTTHNGASAYDIRLQQVYTKEQDPSGTRGNREARDIYISPDTFLVAAVAEQIHFSAGTNDQGVSHEILYSNYQAENGTMVPLNVVEAVQGVVGFTINVNQVTFNAGLADSDFAW